MTSAGSPEPRRPSLIDINLTSVERRRKEERPPISLFSVIVAFLILALAYAIVPLSDIPNLYGLWHEQQDDIDSLEETLAEREDYRVWLVELAGQAGDLTERIDELESLLDAMEQDYTTLSRDRVTWSEVLEGIEDAAPAGVSLTSITQGSDVEIEGTAASDALISEYAAALENTGLFSKVEITEHEVGGTTSSSDIIIETCDTVWNRSQTVVFTLADYQDYKVGLGSAKQSITAPFSTGLVAYQNVAKYLSQSKDIVFWVKSDTDQPAGIFQLVFFSPAFGPYTPVSIVKSYSNNTDVLITDFPSPAGPAVEVNSDITVPYADDLMITSVDVYVKIVHTKETDLIVEVKHPDGTKDVLKNVGAGDSVPDACPCPPGDDGEDIDEWYTGRTIFNGKHSYGTGPWQLLVQDRVTGDAGSIDSWTLKITGTIPLVPAPTPTPAATPTPTATPTAWPTIDYSPLSFCFGAMEGINPWNQILQIWNSGAGTLNWEVTSSRAWLMVGPADANPYFHSGSSTGETDYVTVSVDVTAPAPALTAGSYTATITIEGVDDLGIPLEAVTPQTVLVYLTVGNPIAVERLDIPALIADTWTQVILPLSSPSDICPDYSVALYATRDPGATVVWLDDIRATVEPTPGPYSFTITVTLAGGGG